MSYLTGDASTKIRYAVDLLPVTAAASGQGLVEYALIVAAVGLALITTVNTLSTAIVSLYSSITQGLTSIGATGQ